MMMEIIQAQWLDFKKTLPKDEPFHVRRERRRAFFAGAMSVMRIMTTIGGDATEDEGVAVLSVVERELGFFGRICGTAEEDRRV